MKTKKQIEREMDLAEAEIKQVLNKYEMVLSMLYDEGEAIVLKHIQRHPNGDYSVFERETGL